MDDSSMEMEKVCRLIKEGRDIENLLDNVDWKEFEQFCAKVLEEHGFRSVRDFRFKNSGRRYQIDILAKRGSLNLAIDCKHWGVRPGKKSGIEKAISRQKKRVAALRRIKMLGPDRKVFPLIVTFMEEDISREKGVFVVPIYKLNSFLLDLESYF